MFGHPQIFYVLNGTKLTGPFALDVAKAKAEVAHRLKPRARVRVLKDIGGVETELKLVINE